MCIALAMENRVEADSADEIKHPFVVVPLESGQPWYPKDPCVLVPFIQWCWVMPRLRNTPNVHAQEHTRMHFLLKLRYLFTASDMDLIENTFDSY